VRDNGASGAAAVEAGSGLARSTALPRELLAGVVLPFLVVRAALLAVAWFGTQLAPSWTYHDPVGATRGWSRVPWLALDVWGRYDTLWYLDVAARGYAPPADLAHVQSNLAFFPLYPGLVRALHALVPAALQGDAARFVVAVALSNVLALLGLAAVHALVREAWGDARLARRTVLYLLLFPAGFFLSCAYSESLFLALAAGALLLAHRRRWWWAAACALLLGLSRPSGVLMAPALALLHLEQRGWRLRWEGAGAAAVAAAPAGLVLHAAHLATLTGAPLVAFQAQAAWGRALSWPWETLLHPAAWHPMMGPIEWGATALFLALGALLVLERRWALGAYALLSVAPILLSGTLMSATRLLLPAFPAFAALARLGEREAVDRAVTVTFALLQASLFLAWSRFYWVA
jgi:hypothetical protein